MPKTQNPKLNALPALRRTLVQRMDQMQDLLIEMRCALDFQLRLSKKLRRDVDILIEKGGRRTKPNVSRATTTAT